jgi:hypothetical protein
MGRNLNPAAARESLKLWPLGKVSCGSVLGSPSPSACTVWLLESLSPTARPGAGAGPHAGFSLIPAAQSGITFSNALPVKMMMENNNFKPVNPSPAKTCFGESRLRCAVRPLALLAALVKSWGDDLEVAHDSGTLRIINRPPVVQIRDRARSVAEGEILAHQLFSPAGRGHVN